jgi:hypothetical protein
VGGGGRRAGQRVAECSRRAGRGSRGEERDLNKIKVGLMLINVYSPPPSLR